MHKIATYGSLKEGAYNHDRMRMGAPVAHDEIFGAMFLETSYPRLYEHTECPVEQQKKYPVEIFEVDDNTYQSIKGMELGAGYFEKEVQFGEHTAIVYFSRPDVGSRATYLTDYNRDTVPHAFN